MFYLRLVVSSIFILFVCLFFVFFYFYFFLIFYIFLYFFIFLYKFFYFFHSYFIYSYFCFILTLTRIFNPAMYTILFLLFFFCVIHNKQFYLSASRFCENGDLLFRFNNNGISMIFLKTSLF